MDGEYSQNAQNNNSSIEEQNAKLAFLLGQLSQTTGVSIPRSSPSQETTAQHSQNTPQNQKHQHQQPNRGIDVRSITSYSQGLRYIVEVLSREPMFKDNVRALIEDQAHQELKWNQERVEITRRQAVRDSGREKLASVLKIVTGTDDSGGAKDQDENEKLLANLRELEAFDGRVYTMLVKLSKDTAGRLAELRVPLFCIKPELVDSRVMEERKRILNFLQDFCLES